MHFQLLGTNFITVKMPHNFILKKSKIKTTAIFKELQKSLHDIMACHSTTFLCKYLLVLLTTKSVQKLHSPAHLCNQYIYHQSHRSEMGFYSKFTPQIAPKILFSCENSYVDSKNLLIHLLAKWLSCYTLLFNTHLLRHYYPLQSYPSGTKTGVTSRPLQGRQSPLHLYGQKASDLIVNRKLPGSNIKKYYSGVKKSIKTA